MKTELDDTVKKIESPPNEAREKTQNLFVKIIEKLPFSKLSGRMTYCIVCSIILLSFCCWLTITGYQINGFPTAWDIRFIFIIVIIFLGYGIKGKSTAKSG
ncbi:hypothetical protein [Brevibacillus laterosporus]|uniref:hypothetical protein n=1 Tax=Brevibacillus laterosporus TaxID=1465 RepID=UPI000B9C3C78|nr:hypothetical protein [Brevibacillus laterosporus]